MRYRQHRWVWLLLAAVVVAVMTAILTYADADDLVPPGTWAPFGEGIPGASRALTMEDKVI